MQTWVDNHILKQETGDSTASIFASATPMRVENYISDITILLWGGAGSTFIFMPLIIPFVNLVNFLLLEKELKIKEAMKIMGLTDAAYFIVFLLQYFFVFIMLSLLLCLIMKVSLLKKS